MMPPLFDPAWFTPLRLEKALTLAVPYGAAALGLLLYARHLQRSGRLHSQVMLLAGLIGFGWLYLYTACWKLAAPIPDPVEESIWMQVWQLRHGQTMYPDPATAPVFGYMYPPVFHVMLAGLFSLFGQHWWVGRLCSIACSLATGGLLYRIIRRQTSAAVPALIGALFFFTFYQLTDEWLDLMRVDSLALYLALLALWSLSRARERPGYLWQGILWTLLACYTKQSTLFVVTAAGPWLLLTQPRAGLRYLLAVAVCGSLLFAALTWWTQGWFAAYTVLDPWRHHPNWTYLHPLGYLLLRSSLLWALALVYIWKTVVHERGGLRSQRGFWVLAFLSACAWSLSNSLMAGSGVHNMTVAAALLCVLIGLGLEAWQTVRWLPAVLCVQLIALIYIPVLPNRVDRQLRQRLLHEASAARGEYLARCLTCAQQQGKTVHDNLGAVDELITTRLWDGQRLIHEVEQGLYDPLIITETYGSAAIRSAVERRYLLTETVSNEGAAVTHALRIYRPRRSVTASP